MSGLPGGLNGSTQHFLEVYSQESEFIPLRRVCKAPPVENEQFSDKRIPILILSARSLGQSPNAHTESSRCLLSVTLARRRP
jgi:hypothetical protein